MFDLIHLLNKYGTNNKTICDNIKNLPFDRLSYLESKNSKTHTLIVHNVFDILLPLFLNIRNASSNNGILINSAFSIEAAQDFKSFHDIDISGEYLSLFDRQIQMMNKGCTPNIKKKVLSCLQHS